MTALEVDIAEWRSFVGQQAAVAARDLEELESHLRDAIDDLEAAGLAEDEAFLIAVKRLGAVDDLSREFAREHTGRLWRQLAVAPAPERSATGLPAALLFAVLAAVAVQVARLIARFPDHEPAWLFRNASLLVLPVLAGWLARRRALPMRGWLVLGAAFVVAAVFANGYPYDGPSATQLLATAHLPVVLWFAVGFAYMGGTVRSAERWMDFVRFTGEWFIYYVLIALGGGVLMGLTMAVLQPSGVDPQDVVAWVLPSGAAGAVVIAAWLVEDKQSVIENMAPVLTMVFTPLFAVMLTVSAAVYAVTGPGRSFDRDLLGVFDGLLVVVLGLVLYATSAREPGRPAGWMDRIQLVAVVAALLLDAMVLGAMVLRVGDLGLTPNRTVALGLNLVLLADLAGTAWLAARFAAGRSGFLRVERWQTAYLPVFGLWAALVVVVLPPVFGFA
jgi:hypothetical protein